MKEDYPNKIIDYKKKNIFINKVVSEAKNFLATNDSLSMFLVVKNDGKKYSYKDIYNESIEKLVGFDKMIEMGGEIIASDVDVDIKMVGVALNQEGYIVENIDDPKECDEEEGQDMLAIEFLDSEGYRYTRMIVITKNEKGEKVFKDLLPLSKMGWNAVREDSPGTPVDAFWRSYRFNKVIKKING